MTDLKGMRMGYLTPLTNLYQKKRKCTQYEKK